MLVSGRWLSRRLHRRSLLPSISIPASRCLTAAWCSVVLRCPFSTLQDDPGHCGPGYLDVEDLCRKPSSVNSIRRPWSVPGVNLPAGRGAQSVSHDEGPRWGVGAGREALASGPNRVNDSLRRTRARSPPPWNSPMFVVDSSGRRSDVSKGERMLRASTHVNMDGKGRATGGQTGLAALARDAGTRQGLTPQLRPVGTLPA